MGGTLSTTAEDLSPADGAAWCKRIGLSQYGCRVGEASLERVRAWSSGFGYETRELYAHLDELGVSYEDHRLKLATELRKALALLEARGGSSRPLEMPELRDVFAVAVAVADDMEVDLDSLEASAAARVQRAWRARRARLAAADPAARKLKFRIRQLTMRTRAAERLGRHARRAAAADAVEARRAKPAPPPAVDAGDARVAAAAKAVAACRLRWDQGRTRVIQDRFNTSFSRAIVPEKASTRRERSER